MNNLAVKADFACFLNAHDCAGGVTGLFCVNPETEVVYYVEGRATICCHSHEPWQINLRDVVGVSGISHLSLALELDSLCVTTFDGQLLLLDPNARKVQEEVGVFDGGVLTAAWSPDGELLALITGEAQLLLLNKDFDVLAEVPLFSRPSRIVPSRPVPQDEEEGGALAATSISWRGDGKYFATVSQSKPGEGVLRVWERNGCVVHALGEETAGLCGPLAWQPNGRHVYAAQHTAGEQRVVMFERNGLGHGGFRVHNAGKIEQLAWSSGSELLAIHVELPEAEGKQKSQCVQVWLRSNWHWYLKQEMRFEMCKGLHMEWHGERVNALTICTSEGLLRKVEFRTDIVASALGTVAVVDGNQLLLTTLRHSIVPPPLCTVTASFNAPVQCLAFLDGAASEVIVAALSNGSISVVGCLEEDFWEDSLGEQEAGAEGDIIHGKIAKMLRADGIPEALHGRCLAWINADTLLEVASCTPEGQGASSANLLLEWKLEGHLPGASSSQILATCTRKAEAPDEVLSAVGLAGGRVLLQMVSGSLWKYQPGGSLTQLEGFPKPCPRMQPTSLPDGGAPAAIGLTPSGEIYLGRTLVASNATSMVIRRGSPPQPDYLLYTTRDSFIHTRAFADLGGLGPSTKETLTTASSQSRRRGLGEGRGENHYAAMHAAMKGHGAAIPSGNILTARAVEHGATIVAAPPDGIGVVLQMPRGNLETIYPRSLVLPAIAKAVEVRDFEEAWRLATSHRVDLNLLVDYGWPSFLHSVKEFVAQVPDDQDLVDMLSALSEDFVTEDSGLYAGLPPALPSTLPDVTPEGTKVALVCQALRDAMLKQSPEIYLKPILTSYATQGQLEDALCLLKEAKEKQLARQASNSHTSTAGQDDGVLKLGQGPLGQHRRLQAQEPPSAEDALSHLLLTVEVEDLYKAALGMYELELAYMIVAHSQRDPGEYMLELQQFASSPEGPLRRYAINIHLKRTSAALRDLLDAGDTHFDRAVQLAREEGKLRELLWLVGEHTDPSAKSKRKKVLGQYGEWLSQKHMQEDAAVAFLAADNLEAALKEYKEGSHWEMAFVLAGRMGYSAEKKRDLAEGLVESLSESSRPAEAARVAAEHLGDADSAAALLSRAREWREALRITALFDRQDLVETTIAPAAAEVAATLLEELGDTKERIAKYDARLREIRQKRTALAAALVERGAEGMGVSLPEDVEDAVSEGGSSIVSGLSAYTQASVGASSTAASTGRPPSTVGGRWPQRKKKSKKGPKIRQGSPEEDQALVSYIKSLAPTSKQCIEVGQLAELLILLGHESDARRLQMLLSDVLSQQKAASENAEKRAEATTKERESVANSLPSKPEVADWKWDILRPA